jgi:hypothetical protein
MSIKTNFKRLAFVMTSALTMGVLTTISPAIAGTPDDLAVNEIQIGSTTAEIGVCSVTTTSGAQKITVTSGRTFTLKTVAGATGEKAYVKLAGNVTVSSSTGWSAANTTTLDDTAAGALAPTSLYANTGDSATILAGAVGSGTITISSTSLTAAIEIISVTVVAACAGNVYSPTYSFVQVRALAGAATSNVDESAGLTVANGGTSYVNIALKDAYDAALSGTGSLIGSATNGAVVSWDSAATVQSSTAYATNRGASGTELFVVQGDANADKPLTTTVTITLDGTVVGTKTIKFRGIPASISIKDVTVGKVGSVGVFRAKVLDAAGNELPSATVSNDATANAKAEIQLISSGVTASAVTLTDGDWSASTQGQFDCTASGVTSLNIRTVISSVAGTYVKRTMPIACGGAIDTWTISMDKATYSPGEIATMTLSAKDSKGFPANTTDTIGTVVQSFGGMTFITAPTAGDKLSSAAGAKTYQLKVDTTEGSFVGSFLITGTTDDKAKTVQYKIASSTATVTNADVLKSIVALIASINKQIQALQKLILARR